MRTFNGKEYFICNCSFRPQKHVPQYLPTVPRIVVDAEARSKFIEFNLYDLDLDILLLC